MIRRIRTDRNTQRNAQQNAPWLLAFLVFLAATVPTVQMVREATSGRLTIELCATRGQSASRILVVRSIDTAPGLPVKHSARPHCPLCISPESIASIPPANGGLVVARVEYLERMRDLPHHEPQSPQRQTNVQSRAPPALA
jgi:hypothetical protein